MSAHIARLIRELSDAVKAEGPFGNPPLELLIVDLQTGVVKIQHPAAV